MNRIIVLNNIERDLAVAGGTARTNQNKDNKLNKDDNKSEAEQLKVDIRGMAGEIAVCKYYNKYPDLRIGPNKRGHDLTLGELRVDVKCTQYSTGFLCAGKNHIPQSAFIYLLAVEDDPEYRLAGWQWSETLIQSQNLGQFGYQHEQSQLRHMDELDEDFK
jgi:hypothetical protein